MKAVRLTNGSDAPERRVFEVTTMLHVLSKSQWSSLFELDHKARNPDARIFPATAKSLQDAKLLEQDGTMNDVVRNIILSTVQVVGAGLDFKLVDPVMRDPANPQFPLRPGPRVMI